jgi:hypothetical protein
VPEFQKRGAIHYHLLCNIQYLSVAELDGLRVIWGNGWIDLKRIDSVENVGAYVAKYLGKANDDNRLFGRKKFFYSLDLLTPVILDKIKDVLDFKRFLDFWSIKKLLWETTIDSAWLGEIQYKVYRI